MKIAFVLPTKNEEKTISEIFTKISEIGKKLQFTPLFVLADDSKDNTRDIARKFGAHIVIGGNKGLGTAMIKGLKYALSLEPDYIFSIDADGQVDLNEIEVFFKMIQESKADLILGSRFLESKSISYNYKFLNRFGVYVLKSIINSLTKLNITDSHGGIRAMKPEVVEHFRILGSHTYVQETIIDAVNNGFRVIEIPSRWLVRQDGNSRVVGSIPKYIFYTLPILLLRGGLHIKFLFPAGIGLILLSVLHLSIVLVQINFNLDLLFARHTLHLTFLFFMAGVNLFFFGFCFELLAKIKDRLSE